MAKRRNISARPVWKRVGFVLLLAAGLSALYLLYLSLDVEKRFAGRRWSIPSKVLSDTTILYPGQAYPRHRVEAKLDRLGYRKVTRPPGQKGEVRAAGSRLDIFLRDSGTPQHSRAGFPVRIHFRQDRIESLTRTDSGEPLSLLEIEPEELMLFFGKEREDRRLVSLKEVPRHFIDALLAAEDARFFHHPGMDPLGTLRALARNLRHGALREGGSTITQQLAKNYFLTPEKTLWRKFKELLISLVMEAKYAKEEILEIYLNEIYMGNKGSVAVHGIGEASFFYFGKPVADLTLSEAATLAGLIRAPNLYSPFAHPERSRRRRDTVLEGMLSRGWISRRDFAAAVARPVGAVAYERYTRRAPYFMDYLTRQLRLLYPPETLSALGLSIYTTLDPEVQRAAEEALEKGLVRLERANPALQKREADRRLQGAVVVLQPRTGYILAMVGGRQYGDSQFNRITQARRQPGSAFKPFLFLAALDGHTTATLLANEERPPAAANDPWWPENYAPVPETRIPLRTALAKSVNRAAADLTLKVGVERVIAAASAFGFSTPLPPVPSLGLGSGEVIPLELARAYCAFAADGLLPHPLSLKEVTDEKGGVLARKHLSLGQATSPEKAYLITSMLRSAVETGTAGALKALGVSIPVAGKTGTTNDFRDAWFVGYTPEILALVWVGFDDGTPVGASGAGAALPIFAELLKAIPQHTSGEWFRRPPGIVTATICPDSGQLAVPDRCPAPVAEVFLAVRAPEGPCPLHAATGWDAAAEPFREIIRDVRKFFRGP